MSDVALTQAPAPVSAKRKRLEPALLSFEKSLYPTDAVFFAVDAGGKAAPVPVINKTTLGTQSQFQKDPSKVSEAGNPQRVEAAFLPIGVSKLRIEFNLAVTGSSLRPQSCDVPAFRDRLLKFTAAYAQADGFRTIGRRIAANIGNGRWAWKNRLLATTFEVDVKVLHPSPNTFRFDAFSLESTNFDWLEGNNKILELGDIIAASLAGKGVCRIQVAGVLDVGPAASVFPSQEFVDRDDNDKMAPGKVLYSVPVGDCERCAAFHEQKIGAALRTIDTWHSGFEEDGVGHVKASEPLAVNPYGQSREGFVVVRRGRKATGNASLYEILKDDLVGLSETMTSGPVSGDAHFAMANLVRGGVFGMKNGDD
jgi:CRISPR-associated protein Csy3